MIAGGDSGGPSFAKVLSGEVLAGVHSLCHSQCLPGQTCGPNSWTWVASTPECADAPIAPVWDEINRYLGAFTTESQPSVDSPAPGFIGTFSKTPPNYQPMWVYAIKNNGDLLWYRKDTGESPWQGPKKVGNGWNFKDVIPAGGNSVYALTNDGRLLWYQHNGFNDGTFRCTRSNRTVRCCYTNRSAGRPARSHGRNRGRSALGGPTSGRSSLLAAASFWQSKMMERCFGTNILA